MRGTGTAAVVAATLALLAPAHALAGYGVQPNGQTIAVRLDASGTVVQPAAIDVLVAYDAADANLHVTVSTVRTWTDGGLPVGAAAVASCSTFRASTEADRYTCPVSTGGLRPGVTYYWWLSFDHRDAGAVVPTFQVSGPFSFTLRAAAPAATRTKEAAATLPAETRWTGARSIEHAVVTDAVYRTMKALGRPRTVAVACWTNADFDSVLRAEGAGQSHGGSTTIGIWFRTQPRWLHLRGSECGDLQRLIDTKAATGKGAHGLATALHETLHAHGIADEATANCYAVQLVPIAAAFLGLPVARARYLGSLAVRATRRSAPAGYWNTSACRDGGRWDLDPLRTNLR